MYAAKILAEAHSKFHRTCNPRQPKTTEGLQEKWAVTASVLSNYFHQFNLLASPGGLSQPYTGDCVQMLPELLCWHTVNLEIAFGKWILSLLVLRNVFIVLNMLFLECFQIPNPDSPRTHQVSKTPLKRMEIAIEGLPCSGSLLSKCQVIHEIRDSNNQGATNSSVSPAFPALSTQGGHHQSGGHQRELLPI